jgi:hypothetical protein
MTDAQPGAPVAFQTVLYFVEVEANKNKTNIRCREAHAKCTLYIQMISKHGSESSKRNLRQVNLMLFHCVGFRRDYPAEIFFFYQGISIFRENLAFPSPLPIQIFPDPFASSRFSIQNKYSFETFVKQTKYQLLTL